MAECFSIILGDEMMLEFLNAQSCFELDGSSLVSFALKWSKISR